MNQFSHRVHEIDPEKSTFQRSPSTKQIQTLNVQRLQKYVLSVQNHFLKKQIELYEWRQKTDFPIVKIESYKVVDQRLEKTHIEVIINSCFQKISQIRELKIQDVTVLIKEAFIGLERLFNKFRLFDVRPEMVIIDQKGKCRVWVNSNFSLNQVQKEVKDFQTFYKNIVNIFEQVTIKNPTSMSFYLSLKTCNCFIKGLKFIEDFMKTKKLKFNQKPQIMKKIASTPNLFMEKLDKRLNPIQQQSKNLRQTIGYLRKRENLDFRDHGQAMTFAGKNSKPLQRRLQQMIQQLPKNQIVEKNNLVLDKFKEKTHNHGGENLKKVFKTIKDFKFRKYNDQQKTQKVNIENTDSCHKSEALQKSIISEKIRAQTTRRDFQPNAKQGFGFYSKHVPLTCKNIEDGARFSVNETRSTSFFNNSGERFCPQQHSINSAKKFGNIKFSEISHKKNSQISEFNKDIENILYGIEGGERGKQQTTKNQTIENENISSRSLHENYDRSQHNISILDHEDLNNEKIKKQWQNRYPTTQAKPSEHQDTSTSAKYGQISDQIQEPTPEELSKKYIELGWKPTLNILSFDDKIIDMKSSIHTGEDHKSGNLPDGSEKKPVHASKLDRIKNKQLVQSVMNEDFLTQ